MLVAAAVCPHPPLLVPEIGVGLGTDIAVLRAECADTVNALTAVAADHLYIVGAAVGPSARSFRPWAPGSDADAVVVDVPEPLPLSLLVGAYLTRGIERSFVVVDPATGPDDCVELGRELADSADRVSLLVMGDGAASHDVKAPGYFDARATAFDRDVHEAFSTGDFESVAAVDPVLADELLCAGRAPWQVLAGAATGVALATVSATLHVPFGVGYHVAAWRT